MKRHTCLQLSLLVCTISAVHFVHAERESKKLLECIKGKVCKIEKKVCDIEDDVDCLAEIPITQTENRVITQPGTYRLCEDIEVAANGRGIDVQADGVIIDMNDHTIFGSEANQNFAIVVEERDNIEIFGGTIRDIQEGIILNNAANGFLHDIELYNTVAEGSRVEPGSREGAIDVEDSFNINILRCIASENLGDGISIFSSDNVVVSECICSDNSSAGIEISGNITAVVIENCVCLGNADDGITASDRVTVRQCTCNGNGFNGIVASFHNTISNCTCNENGRWGISASGDNTISNCTCNENGFDGIDAEDNNTISNCTCNDNTSKGILVQSGCIIDQCTCNHNASLGMLITSSFCSVTRSTANHNESGIVTGDGVGKPYICDNVCTHNINFGIELSSTTTQACVLRNKCGKNNIGIRDDATGLVNLIADNLCTNNTTDDYQGVAPSTIIPLFDDAMGKVGLNLETP